jgi:hypothetical protein
VMLVIFSGTLTGFRDEDGEESSDVGFFGNRATQA